MINDFEMLKSKLVVMFCGKTNALFHGSKVYMNSAPYLENGRIYVPIDGLSEGVGFDYIYEDGRIKVAFGDKEVFADVYFRDEVMYVSGEDIALLLGIYCRCEENGLIYFYEDDIADSLDWVNNMWAMRNVSESFMFDDMSGEEMYSRLVERFPAKKHPRLIVTEEELELIRCEIASPDGDIVYKKIFENTKKFADEYLVTPPIQYDIPDGIRLLQVCRGNVCRITILSLMYHLTGDNRYAEGAYDTMLCCAEFPDWNPYHFLDVGEMSFGMAVGYDWLYNWMSDEQRTVIREAMVRFALYPIMEDFQNKPRRRSWNWRGQLADNWRLVIGSVGLMCMAIADELNGEALEYAKFTMEQTLVDIRRALSLFAPYGAYEEGIAYWNYGMRYFVYTMKSLLTALGDDLGYIHIPGMNMTNNYVFAMFGNSGIFTYHDCNLEECVVPPETMFFADYFGKYSEAEERIKAIMSGDVIPINTISDLFLYKKHFRTNANNDRPLDVCLPLAEIATMRSGYGKNDMYVGFHCDNPIEGEGHDHMDSGVFVLDAMGENFFLDFGKDDYTLPDYLNCYRVRDEGHNVVIFNPDEGYSMKYGGYACIEEHKSGNKGAYAIGNLSAAYRDEHRITSYRRGVGLMGDRRICIVQDEIRLDKKSELYWFAHTRAKIDISDEGKSAILDINGKKLEARIMSGQGAFFEVMDAKPLETSPKIPGQDENLGVSKLTVHLKAVEKLDLCIAFAPLGEVAIDNYETKALDGWCNII